MIKIIDERRILNGKPVMLKTLLGIGTFSKDITTKEVQSDGGLKTLAGGFGQDIVFNYIANGEDKTITFEVACWGKMAKELAQVANKGSSACVLGRAEEVSYISKTDGLKKTKNHLTIESFEIVNENNQLEDEIEEGIDYFIEEEIDDAMLGFEPVENFAEEVIIPF